MPGRPAVASAASSSAGALEVEAGDLGGGLLDVAEVGEEAAHVRPDDRQAVGAGEAGQVAHVDEVGDEQQVELALASRGGDAVRAARSAPP